MHLGSFDSFTDCYTSLIEEVYRKPEYESAPRGHKIKEVLGASFTLTNPRCRIPYVVGRKFSVSYMVAELIWYLSGNNKTSWISNYSKFWESISDDGITANSAYGARLFKTNEKIAGGRYKQIDYVIDELRRDPDSRRAIMHLRVPDDSIDAKLDVPCTLALQFFIRDNKLHQVAMMRSSDLIFGIAYDIPAFTVFQELLANELGVDLGTYTHVSSSLHIYERHFGMVEKILESRHNRETSKLLQKKCGGMPPIQVGIYEAIETAEAMVGVEQAIQECRDDESVLKLYDELDFHSPFDDWMRVIVAARLKKISKNSKSASRVLEDVEFDGYSFTNKGS